jgi:hypothetical protein
METEILILASSVSYKETSETEKDLVNEIYTHLGEW